MSNHQYISKKKLKKILNIFKTKFFRKAYLTNVNSELINYAGDIIQIINDMLQDTNPDFIYHKDLSKKPKSLKAEWIRLKTQFRFREIEFSLDLLRQLAIKEFLRILKCQHKMGWYVPSSLLEDNHINYPDEENQNIFCEKLGEICKNLLLQKEIRTQPGLASVYDRILFFHQNLMGYGTLWIFDEYIWSKRNWKQKYWFLQNYLNKQ